MIQFANFVLEKTKEEPSFMFACKDREVSFGERWVFASLFEDEAKQVYEYLKKYFSEEEP